MLAGFFFMNIDSKFTPKKDGNANDSFLTRASGFELALVGRALKGLALLRLKALLAAVL
jgi:hypothetical protein